MIRRGWPPAELMAMRPADFAYWLDQAVGAAKDEAKAIEAASKGK